MASTDDKVTFYTAAICPFAQRVAIAFNEIGLAYEKVEIDLSNKPSWYKDVNPETKVPALTIQGKNIAESLVLIELANDLKPEQGLLPADPVKRAQIRFVIEYWATKVSAAWYKSLRNNNEEGRKEYSEALNVAYTRAPSGPYFLGSDYSLADIAIAPFVARQAVAHQKFYNNFEAEAVKKFPRLQEFLEGIVSRPSFKATYAGDQAIVNNLINRHGLKPSSL
ncbi:glutathione S-transferase [Fennellomyces sp. T-0311]|nr:glutathione S-transferase [Fennellomyces sp. T-0311]